MWFEKHSNKLSTSRSIFRIVVSHNVLMTSSNCTKLLTRLAIIVEKLNIMMSKNTSLFDIFSQNIISHVLIDKNKAIVEKIKVWILNAKFEQQHEKSSKMKMKMNLNFVWTHNYQKSENWCRLWIRFEKFIKHSIIFMSQQLINF